MVHYVCHITIQEAPTDYVVILYVDHLLSDTYFSL